MGGDIAAWCALRGLTVTVQDRAMQYVEPALERAKKLFEKRLRGPGEAEAAIGRLTVDLQGDRVSESDVVIEAIVERLDAKSDLFTQSRSESRTRDDTRDEHPRASSWRTSHRPCSTPDRLVGLHFFNPVAKLPLVEVIRTDRTRDAVLDKAMAFVTQIGKLPLPCRSAPGFVVNRILTPYMLEALRAHEDGYALETIDRAAVDFGMPTGPVELADRVGLDIALHVIGVLGTTLDARSAAAIEGKSRRRTSRGQVRTRFLRVREQSSAEVQGLSAPRTMSSATG